MKWKISLAMVVALCLVTTSNADYWVETFDNGPTGGFDQTWTPHDWGVASGLPALQVYEISPAAGGADSSYYGVFGESRPAGIPEIVGSEDYGELPPYAALQFASVDDVIFDDNGGRLYVEMRINPAQISARNIAFITTNMQVLTIPGDLNNERFNFLDLEPDPDVPDPILYPEEPTDWETDVGIFNPSYFVPNGLDSLESFGFGGSPNDSPRPESMTGQPYTGEYTIGFWVVPNASDHYVDSRPDIPLGATLMLGDIRQSDGMVIAQSNDDEEDGFTFDMDDFGEALPPGPVGVGFYNDGLEPNATNEGVTFDQIVAMTYYDGDFGTDGDVDGNDFLAWQTGFGTMTYASPRIGDADWDADVDASDQVLWADNFGVNVTATANAASVPEASSLVLLMLGGLGLLGHGRRSC